MKQKEPFAFARNLKIFIIVLCALPLVGIAMLIFLPKQLNGVTAEVIPLEEPAFDFDALYAAVKSGSREYDETVKTAVEGLIGDVRKTMTITAKLVPTADKVIFVCPYNTGESGTVGVRLFIYGYSYARYEKDSIGAVTSAPVAADLAPLGEGRRYGLMSVVITAPETVDFCYNYEEGKLCDPVGKTAEIAVKRIELDLAEDSVTRRLEKTVCAFADVNTEGLGALAAENLRVVSRRNAGGFRDVHEQSFSTKLQKYAFAGEEDVEKGAYFVFDLKSGASDLSKITIGIVNVEDEIDGETSPAFYLNMKVFYDIASK